ncbi:MAG: AAA family ATPase, partial [Candidatus Fonsibacter sp.]
MFSGPQGCGLDSAILAFSAALICVDNGCGECSDCQNVILGVHPDLEILSTSGLSIKIDEIRELIEKSNWAPSISKRRVLVINEAERLTEAASNALLRAIEEPNDNVVWLLASYTADSLSATIKSRCNMVRLKSPSRESITNVLLKEFKLSSEEAENISRICLNDLDRAKDLAKNKELLVFRKQVLSRLLKLKNLSDAFQIAQFIVEECKQISEQNLEETDDQEISNLKQSWGSSGSKMVVGGARLIKELEKTQKN